MSSRIAVLDACVLFSAQLRDLMMHLTLNELFSARWSEEIFDEWSRNVVAKHIGATQESVDRCRKLMNSHSKEALVVGYQGRTSWLTLPDPKDRHVLAAAIHSGASLIVTFNLKDFPEEALASFGIEAIHPDDFVLSLLTSHPGEVIQTIRSQRLKLTKPEVDAQTFLDGLERLGLRQTVSLLNRFAELL
jgi:predicted nucleic acid-binding protein